LDETGIVGYALFVAVVTVDEHHEVGGLQGHLSALIVASRGADTSLGIPIDG
jgi:transketolase C-terminal domain/subunit